MTGWLGAILSYGQLAILATIILMAVYALLVDPLNRGPRWLP